MPDELRQIIPVPQPEIEEVFAAYHVTSQFYQEVQSRTAWEQHCDWYNSTAAAHKQELQRMRGEINILSWFRLRK